MRDVLLSLATFTGLLSFASASPISNSRTLPRAVAAEDRLDQLKSMYGFEGFVYALDDCPSPDQLQEDFSAMKSKGARNVLTFDLCGSGDDAGYYETVLQAAENSAINVMPLAWTLRADDSQTWEGTSMSRINAVVEAVIARPDAVLAIAIGDEPLFDADAPSPNDLAQTILSVKSQLNAAGLSIPVSISDMAFGWQNAGDITPVADAVDFFMINNFPYFAPDASSGSSGSAWNDFENDITYFEGIANGKPLLVTQTGWPSDEDEFKPNSEGVVATVSSEEGYWNLLDGHCEDYFKAKNIGWMWRSWNDVVDGWGVMDADGNEKWDFSARTTC